MAKGDSMGGNSAKAPPPRNSMFQHHGIKSINFHQPLGGQPNPMAPTGQNDMPVDNATSNIGNGGKQWDKPLMDNPSSQGDAQAWMNKQTGPQKEMPQNGWDDRYNPGYDGGQLMQPQSPMIRSQVGPSNPQELLRKQMMGVGNGIQGGGSIQGVR